MKTDVEHTNHGKADRTGTAGRFLGQMAAAVIMLLTLTAGVASAKSMYVIAKVLNFGNPIPILMYDIGPDGKLTFQEEYGAPDYGIGMMALALDSNSGTLFATYEEWNSVLVLDATTLKSRRVVYASDAKNLAGIVYDHDRGLVYAVDRRTEILYAFQWNSVAGTLNPQVGSPFRLAGAASYGIALDEINDLLYAASPSVGISVYKTSDWQLVRNIPTSRLAISIAVDPERNYVYYGAGYAFSYYLTRHNLVDDSEKEILIDPNAGVIGLTVDPATGLVYTTTGRDNRSGGDDLLVFTPDLELIQTIEDIGNPTGIAIPLKQTSFNPLQLAKTITKPWGAGVDAQGRTFVTIGGEVTYSISFDPSLYNPSEVTLVDQLPPELTFVSATGHTQYGQYDEVAHRYIWTNPPLAMNARTFVELTVRLDAGTPPGRVVVNTVTIDSDKTPATTISTGAVATEAIYHPLQVRKTVVAPAASGNGSTIYARPDEEITYRISFDNKDNDYTVKNIVIVDALPEHVQFVRATGDGTFGFYDRATHTYTWTYPSLAAAASNSVDLVVRLDANVAPGTIITNSASVKSDQTPEVRQEAEVVIGFAALELETTVVSPVDELDDRGRPYVDTGENVTYRIRVRNSSPSIAATEVEIVDRLPSEMTFVSAGVAGDAGSYDSVTHTYSRRYPSLGPGGEISLDLVAQVKEAVEPNTVISNTITVTSRETAPSQARAEVVVAARVIPPIPDTIPGQMFLKPTYIWRNKSKATQDLMVVVHLPEGYGMETIAHTPLVLTPGEVQSRGMKIFGSATQGKVLCFFDTDPILAATQGYGEFPIQVVGKLVGGQSFVCDGTISILKFGGP